MLDIAWSIEDGDIITTGSGSTLLFAVTTNPSVQNAGIILEGKGMAVLNPNYGIGVQELINGSLTNATFQMNRWKGMVNADGASFSAWKYSTQLGVFSWAASYLPAPVINPQFQIIQL